MFYILLLLHGKTLSFFSIVETTSTSKHFVALPLPEMAAAALSPVSNNPCFPISSSSSSAAPLTRKLPPVSPSFPNCLFYSCSNIFPSSLISPRQPSTFSPSRYHRRSIFTSLVNTTTNPSIGDASNAEQDTTPTPHVQVHTSTWNWKGYNIRYQYSGSSGPALVLIHGFGANSDHWRKNIPVLAQSHKVFAIDLIGYGYSDKPNPKELGLSSFYTFETWASQLNDFCVDVVMDEVFFVCNSIGGIVGLQAAVSFPQICKGIVLLNISLRMLHIKKQPWYGKPLIRAFQNLLRDTPVGKYFYRSVATPDAVKNILCQCYHDKSQVTEELVEVILGPGLQEGAADVFLEFICYSGGPLPEDLLPQVKVPVLVAWGDKDPWEAVEEGRRAYGEMESIEDFVIIPNVGHCPHDEAPHLVNPLILSFVARHQPLPPP